MKKSRFREEQMVTILREADRRPVPEVAQQHGVSAQTIYSWRKHFGTLEPADVKRLRQLEQENGRLKKMVADRDLEIDVSRSTPRVWISLGLLTRRGLRPPSGNHVRGSPRTVEDDRSCARPVTSRRPQGPWVASAARCRSSAF